MYALQILSLLSIHPMHSESPLNYKKVPYACRISPRDKSPRLKEKEQFIGWARAAGNFSLSSRKRSIGTKLLYDLTLKHSYVNSDSFSDTVTIVTQHGCDVLSFKRLNV